MASQFEEIVDLLVDFGEGQVKALTQSLEKKGVHNSSLAGTIKFTVKRVGQNVQYQLSMADYYIYLDQGRRAGKKPPRDAIKEWIEGKEGMVPSSIIQSMFSSRGLQAPPSALLHKNALNTLSFLIQRAIGQKGTIKRFGYQGSNFYSDVVNQDALDKLSDELLEITGKRIVLEIVDPLNDIKDVKISA